MLRDAGDVEGDDHFEAEIFELVGDTAFDAIQELLNVRYTVHSGYKLPLYKLLCVITSL